MDINSANRNVRRKALLAVPLAGLLARAVVVIDKAGRVVYTELVPEITEEPDYDKAVEAVKAN